MSDEDEYIPIHPAVRCFMMSRDGAGGRESSPDSDTLIRGPWSSGSSAGPPSPSEHKRPDESTCCDEDFTWVSSQPEEKRQSPQKTRSSSRPPKTSSSNSEKSASSLDRRRTTPPNRNERDQKSRSSHSLKSNERERDKHRDMKVNMNDFMIPPPPARSPKQHYGSQEINHHRYNSQELGPYWMNSSCPSREDVRSYSDNKDMFHRRHERSDPWRYGSSSALMDRRAWEALGSQEFPVCCGYRLPPPPPSCCQCEHRQHWPPVYQKPGEVDERVRRLEGDKDSLQLQVSVLSEQISAQTEKIADLERMLQEKRSLLNNAEDCLQREMLTRSSLETQKLELMSAMSELKLQQAALERENMELRSGHYNNNIQGIRRPPLLPRSSPGPPLSTTPLLSTAAPSSISASPLPAEHSPKTPPATFRRQIDLQYGSLPRQAFPISTTLQGSVDNNANLSARKGVAFGKLTKAPARGHSVPNLAETERILIEDNLDSASTNGVIKPTVSASPSPVPTRTNKGLRSIFGKIRRSSSGNLEDLPSDEGFSRGGIRATAGPRLCWTDNQNNKPEIETPFKEWDGTMVLSWVQNDLGLEIADSDALKQFVTGGAKLLEATPAEIEKNFAIKNPLHKKKLNLALNDLRGTSNDVHLSNAGKLDTAWVLRWLDDAGLPQYKDAFLAAQIDGRVLHRLTMDDLAALHVTSMLHVASLKRGIQVLREHEWNPTCMVRRSLPTDSATPTPEHIATWSAHRVMEWLKLVDLAEYATNLRGAGVHGGLMVHEPKFSGDLLAALLSIPTSKTLLRRHLATHFKELLGRDVIQIKREAEATLGYIPLTLTSKVKVAKKAQFSLKRRKGRSDDMGDLVCPLNDPGLSGETPSTPLPTMKVVAVEVDVCEGDSTPSDSTNTNSSCP